MGFILVIHILSAILLIITVLMQAGRGGGLAESFASAESMFGTQTNVFLVRVTTVLAAVFFITSLFLAFNGSRTNKSLMADKKLLPKVEQDIAKNPAPKAEQEPEVSIKIEEPKPMDPTGDVQGALKPVVNATTP